MTRFFHILRYETSISLSTGASLYNAFLFFIAILITMPFALGPDLQTLQKTGLGIIWLAVFLSMLLSIDQLLERDINDGTWQLYQLSKTETEIVLCAKAINLWLTNGLPLSISTIFFCLLYNIDPTTGILLALSLIFGTLGLAFLLILGAALTANISKNALLAVILLLPLATPLLIFGTLTAQNMADGNIFSAAFLILLALTLFNTVIGLSGALLALSIKPD